MILLQLTSNKTTFKTINFNPSGLSLIVGRKESVDSTTRKKTYNAVGKSLCIRLVHFCLGSSKSDELKKSLPGWEFSLKFKIGTEVYTAKRSTEKQEEIFLNTESYSISAFSKKMLALTCGEEVKSPNTFRPLISRFVRANKAAYVNADEPVRKEQPYYNCANTSLLLGLDIDPVRKKSFLKKEKDKNASIKRSLEKDPVLNSFYTGDKDAGIELAFIENKINQLEENLEGFRVADDYHEIQKEADDLALSVSKLENKRALIEISIDNITKSLRMRTDISREKVDKLYEEANFKLSEQVTKDIDEVLEFHEKIIVNRRIRLELERTGLRNELKIIEEERKSLGKKLDDSLSYLNEHTALDEFVSLSNKLSRLKAESQKIRDFEQLFKEYDLKNQQLTRDLTQSNIDTQDYLLESLGKIQKIQKVFSEMANQLFENKPAGISITNNEGENQLRYNISSKIQSDSSDGVNEAKIFCLDMTLLRLQQNHNFKFVFHDSRLYSDMDPRQRQKLFNIAYKISNSEGYQYIATVNEDQLDSFKDLMGEEEFKAIVSDSIVLELTDASSESKLLGVEVDLSYDK